MQQPVVHQEVERKYLPSRGARIPSFELLPGVAAVVTGAEQRLDATYLDTPDLVLARNGITLRRRTGGPDAGWHLKLPSRNDTRWELREPLGQADDGPPAALSALLPGLLGDRELAAVAQIRTRRRVSRLEDAGGRVLAELCDDLVSARRARDGAGATWHEWELELGSGDPTLLETAARLVRRTGAVPATARTKLAVALAGDLSSVPEPAAVPRSDPARVLVQAHLDDLCRRLAVLDPAVRADLPDAVHQMRVALRRFRSALRTFRPLVDRTRTDPLRAEMRWLATVLGSARDSEVVTARLQEVLARSHADERAPTAHARLDAACSASYGDARRAVDEALSSARYGDLRAELDARLAAPPWRGSAERPVSRVVPRLVRRTWVRLRKAHDAAARAHPEEAGDLLHEVRKSAKALRYAAEAAAPAYGAKALRLARAAEDVQTLLGDHHDIRVADERLAVLAQRARDEGDDRAAKAFRTMRKRERRELAQVQDAYAAAWERVSDPDLRRWLRVRR